MKIKMYGLTTCPHCKNALKFLESSEVEYEVTWLDELSKEDRQKTMQDMKNISESYSVPLVVKGDKWVLGFNKEKLEELIK
ncbi:MAG: glutaredoxin family protein [Candidatus Caldatribacteriota bacterium]|nr:glutaredoxin family protein [Atribacterota bacterium]MDD4764952.1 glutaredoxin family protein [Atribacterota bacterium]